MIREKKVVITLIRDKSLNPILPTESEVYAKAIVEGFKTLATKREDQEKRSFVQHVQFKTGREARDQLFESEISFVLLTEVTVLEWILKTGVADNALASLMITFMKQNSIDNQKPATTRKIVIDGQTAYGND